MLLRGRAAYVVRTGEATVFTPALFEELRSRGEVDHVGTPAASWLGAPLRSGDRTIGVITVQDYDAEDCYSDHEKAFLGSVAAQVSLAIDRQRAQEALLENQARLGEAQRMAHVGVWEEDHRHGRLSLSDEAFRILGIAPGDFDGTVQALQAAIHPDDLESLKRAFDTSFATEGPHELDHRLLLSDGRVRWVKARWRNEVGTSGVALRTTGTMQDLTEQLLAREARSLAEAKEAAEAANRAKSVFLASMSHEIRTPMNAILGFSQLLLGDPDLTPQQKVQLQAISRGGEHLLNLIDDVLEMSKIEAGRTTVNEAETDLHTLLSDVESMFRLRTDEKGLFLAVERSPDLPRVVRTDEGKLRQILINLMGNAVKFTAKGGLTVRARTEPSPDGAGLPLRLLLEVEDTGAGISADELPQLFQRFEQTRTGREASTGTGLGLAISRGFAHVLGGDIAVRSRAGEGSVFTLSLPVTPLPGRAAPPKDVPRRATGLPPDETRRRVLVADDVAANRLVLKQMLGRIGFDVRSADDGRQALELFSAWRPDLVLMDIRMPVMDGLDAIRSIRARESGSRIPIVAITASAFEDERRRVEEAGGDDFVVKPFRESELLQTVSRCTGIRLLYEGDPDAPRQAEPRRIPPVPSRLRDALLAAVVTADLDRILSLTDEAAGEAPEAARLLRELAEHFEYDRIRELLKAQAAARPEDPS